jgi:hypothetical protein
MNSSLNNTGGGTATLPSGSAGGPSFGEGSNSSGFDAPNDIDPSSYYAGARSSQGEMSDLQHQQQKPIFSAKTSLQLDNDSLEKLLILLDKNVS